MANSSTLLTIEETGITEEIASMVEDILSEHVLETTPIRMLECGSYLPEIKVPWSDWLVYSVLRKWGKKFDVATTSPSFRMATPLVAPKGEMNAERFSTLPAVKLFVFEKCDNLDDIDDLLKDVFDDEALEAELWDSKC